MDDGGDRMRWAEALAIERLHGSNALRWSARRIEALAFSRDDAGVHRFEEVVRRLEALLAGAGRGTPS